MSNLIIWRGCSIAFILFSFFAAASSSSLHQLAWWYNISCCPLRTPIVFPSRLSRQKMERKTAPRRWFIYWIEGNNTKRNEFCWSGPTRFPYNKMMQMDNKSAKGNSPILWPFELTVKENDDNNKQVLCRVVAMFDWQFPRWAWFPDCVFYLQPNIYYFALYKMFGKSLLWK